MLVRLVFSESGKRLCSFLNFWPSAPFPSWNTFFSPAPYFKDIHIYTFHYIFLLEVFLIKSGISARFSSEFICKHPFLSKTFHFNCSHKWSWDRHSIQKAACFIGRDNEAQRLNTWCKIGHWYKIELKLKLYFPLQCSFASICRPFNYNKIYAAIVYCVRTMYLIIYLVLKVDIKNVKISWSSHGLITQLLDRDI